MYYYQVGYGTCEESHFITVASEKKLSEAELDELFLGALLQVRPKVKNSDSDFERDKNPSFQHLIDSEYFIPALKDAGLTPVEYEQKSSVFGWAASDIIGDWQDGYYQDNLTVKFQTELAKESKNAK